MSTVVYLKIFAGLGLFFVGINFFSEHLKSNGKPYIRKIIKKFTGNGLKCMLSGAMSGALTNSAKAVTFSLAPIISSGMLNVTQSLPIIIGASFGSALLVLWVSFDFKLAELFLLGMAGMYYQFGNMKKGHVKFLAGVLLGLGLIFFGLDMLKSGAAEFKDSEQIIRFAEATHGYWVAALMLGAVSAFMTQSGSTMSIVAITFVDAGLLDFDQAVMFVYGTNIGSGFSTAMLSFTMAGVARQLVMFHAGIKMAASLLLVPMLYLETYAGIPFVKAFSGMVSPGLGEQIGTIYVTYEVVSGLLVLGFLSPISAILARYWPPSNEELLSQAKFIKDRDQLSVDQAIHSLAKEQLRIMRRALRYFDVFQTNMPDNHRLGYDTLHEANTALQKEIHQLLVDLPQRNLTKKQSEEVLHRSNLQEWIEALDKALFELVGGMDNIRKAGVAPQLREVVLKALSELLTSVNAALADDDALKAHVLIESTKRRISIFRRVKPKAISNDLAHQKTLMSMLVTYERIVWLVVNMAHAIAHDDIPRKQNDVLEIRAPSTPISARSRSTSGQHPAANHPGFSRAAGSNRRDKSHDYLIDYSRSANS